MATTPTAVEKPIETPVTQEKLQPIQPQGGPLPASVFKNEGVDVAAAALERNELGKLNHIPEPPQAAPAAPLKQEAQPEPVPAVEPAKSEPVQEKLLAGKYKNVDELEKGYLESQKGFSQKVQVEAEKKAQELLQAKLKELAGEKETAQVVQTVKPLSQLSSDEHLDLFTRDPVEYNRRQQSELLNAIKVSQTVEQWNRDNADIKNEIVPNTGITGEQLVNLQVLSLAQADPSRAADYPSLLAEATGSVRNLFNGLRNQGKQEAMVARETTAPLQASVAPATTDGNRAQPAVPKISDPLADEEARIKEEQRRIRAGHVQTRVTIHDR